MTNMIKNSFLWKFGLKTIEIYKNGAIHRTLESFKTHYKTSKTSVLWNKFVHTESAIETSLYKKISDKFSNIILVVGSFYEKSILCKFFNFCVNLLIKLTKDSVVLKPFHKLTFKGFLLVIFGLYLPVDYILRSVINIPALASVWDELLFVLFIVTILYRHMTKKTTKSLKITPLDGYLYMFLTVGLFLMCYVSPYFYIAVAGYRAVIQYILWFFVIIRLIEDDRDFKILYNTLVAMIICIGLHGVYQFIIGVEIPSTWVTSTEEAVRTRVFSLTGSPNIMGSILVLLTPMIVAFAYTSKNLTVKILSLGTTGLMCLSLLFTYSKGAWLGMALTVFVFALFVDRRLIALMLAGGAGVVVAVPSVVNRITYLFTEDYVIASEAGGRMLRWDVGLDLLRDSSEFFGFGLGRFGGAVAMQNQVIEITKDFSYFYMDNYYLKTLVEMGYLGLGFYILLLVALVVLCIKAIGRTYGTNLYVPCVSMFSGMMGVLVHCYYENIFEVPYMQGYFWAMCAMIMYAGFIKPKNTSLEK